jgi:hypothetical protein
MRRLTLGRFLVLLMLLGGTVPLVSDLAYAICCMCMNPCKSGCTCRGTPGCPSCALPDTINMRKDVRGPASSFVVEPVSSDRLRTLAVDRQCPKNNPSLRLTTVVNDLTIMEPAFAETDPNYESVVALRNASDGQNSMNH